LNQTGSASLAKRRGLAWLEHPGTGAPGQPAPLPEISRRAASALDSGPNHRQRRPDRARMDLYRKARLKVTRYPRRPWSGSTAMID